MRGQATHRGSMRLVSSSSSTNIISPLSRRTFSSSSHKSARLIARPQRPYTFTQLVALSDGSTYLQRTTSPLPVYRSNRDTRNVPMWNPSNARLANAEDDEAGRLSAFRRRFGESFDAASADPSKPKAGSTTGSRRKTEVGSQSEQTSEPRSTVMPGDGKEIFGESQPGDTKNAGDKQTGESSSAAQKQEASKQQGQGEDNLMDLISSYGESGYKPPPDLKAQYREDKAKSKKKGK